MEETLITFETAKLAKEKGFDLKTHNYYSKDKYEKVFRLKQGYCDDYWGDNYCFNWNTQGEPYKPFSKDCYSAPTQSLLQKWLREVHNIHIVVDYFFPDKTYLFTIYTECERIEGSEDYKTYEEALEKGLYEALKLIP